jgi:DNA modification methylase
MAAGRGLTSSRDRAKPSILAQIEWVPIEVLRRNPKNARTHSKKQTRQIAASIRTFGFLSPAIVDDENMILAGHGRFEAARQEGLAHVPILRFSHLTEAQKRAFAIADNRIAEQAGWDRHLLSIELGDLIDLLPVEGLDVSLTGFETPEIDLLLADSATTRPTPEDAMPRMPRHGVTRPGDLWLLGKHRLMCGDAGNADDLGRLMDGALAAAVFCDPTQLLGKLSGREKIQHPEFAFDSTEISSLGFRRFLSQALGNGVRVCADGAVQFVCMDWRRISDLIEVSRELYGEMLNLVVWHKTNAGSRSFYRSQHEFIGVFRVGRQPKRNKAELKRFGRNRSDVWSYPDVKTTSQREMGAFPAHPAAKPVALIADALLDCTARGEIVLDQFAGSGATILAAERVGRIARGLEREPRSVDVAVLRWQCMTKLKATLAGDGRTYGDTADARAGSTIAPNIEGGKPSILRDRNAAVDDGGSSHV